MIKKSRLRSLPLLGMLLARAAKLLRRATWSFGRRAIPLGHSVVDVPLSLPMYVPNIGVPDFLLNDIIFASVEETPALLEELAKFSGLRPAKTAVSREFCSGIPGAESRAEELGQLLALHGSDKSTVHDYHFAYGCVLEPGTTKTLLEIGLGTNNPEVPSSMGANGRPGASLRAFRDFLPNASILGADVDERILFEEERISTYVVDATDEASLRELFSRIPSNLDLIIDDGLHAPHANLRVLRFGLESIRPGGWVFIEDIGREKRPIWELVGRLLPVDRFDSWLIEGRASLLFAVQRRE